ncbi:MAG: helix-turn-helix domain-containing protein [Pyrinomonadaceae bacterium]
MAKGSLPDSNAPIKICYADGCGNAVLYKGLCNAHYLRMKRHGDLLSRKRPTLRNYWDGIQKGENPDDCWAWTGPSTGDGYGKFFLNGRYVRAHCYSFFLHNGFWAKGYVLHTCDNRSCCNPRHLYDGTYADNMRDKMVRERQTRGEMVHCSRLTESDVKAIKSMLSSNVSQAEIARLFGVDPSTISNISTGTTWKHIA